MALFTSTGAKCLSEDAAMNADNIRARIAQIDRRVESLNRAGNGGNDAAVEPMIDKLMDERDELSSKLAKCESTLFTRSHVGLEACTIKSSNEAYQFPTSVDSDDFKTNMITSGLTADGSEETSDYTKFFRYPEYNEAIKENFDLHDEVTRKALLCVTEADQNNILTSLTSRLYDHIVDKAEDIDFGDIPLTNGDVTKLPNYDKITDCIEVLRELLKEYKQDTSPVEEIATALSNIQTRKDLFGKAFRYNIELPQLMYCSVVLSIIESISLLVSTSIEFIKSPNQEGFAISLDKVAMAKTKQNMLFNNLAKFNKSCKKGEFDKAMNHVIGNTIKHEVAAEIAIGASIVAGSVAVIAILLNIIPILREMVYFFYYTRTRVSDFFDVQADLLQMNAYNLQANQESDPVKRDKIVKKQLKLVDMFRSVSNKLSIVGKEADVKASKDIANSNKKLSKDDMNVDKTVTSSIF